MKKYLVGLFAGSALFVNGTISAVAAELGYGITAAIVNLEADGSETETGSQTAETTNASVSHTFPIASIFAEMQGDRWTLGLDYIPIDADVSDKAKSRTDTETSVTGNNATTSTSRTNTAQAELAHHLTTYVEFKPRDSMYFKLGYIIADLNTTESLDTGSSYGNASLNGIMYGVGFKNDLNRGYLKMELTYSDYDNISLTDSTGRTGVTTNNKISADLDATQLRISYGF